MKNNHTATLAQPLVTPEHLRRRAFIYLRQSSPEQVEKNVGSQAFQRSQEELARLYGWPEDSIEVIEDDLGKSGSTVSRRTGWQKMLKEIAANAVGAVFVAHVSRLGREMLPIEELRILASHHGTLLWLDNRFYDPSDPNDTVLTQVTASFSQYENKKRTEHMTKARMAKARQGSVVSLLPVGWIKTADGKYDYDPAVKDAISAIIDTFMKVRSIRKTLKALTQSGIKVPAKPGRHLTSAKPTVANIRRILINPAYSGVYVYGKTESQRGGPVLATGQSPRVKVPEHRWVKILDHHPAYMTVKQQEEIKLILGNNNFLRRNRPGRGPALLQGLLRSAVCGKLLTVTYHRNQSFSYGCAWDTEPCTHFVSYDFDDYVVREVFRVLETPPLEILQAALAASRSQERTRLNWVESERERLDHEERKAQERADLTRGELPRVHRDALQRLENVLQEKEEFERKIAFEESQPKIDQSEEELEELCRLASDLPGLWHHSVVSNQERKEILRSLIDHVLVTATKKRIDAIIVWNNGETTPIAIWRGTGRYNLVHELHAQGLTVFEIQEHLAAGKTSTGQKVEITIGRLYMILGKLGLKPNRFTVDYLSLKKRALELNREGKSLESIACQFEEEGIKSASGKPWTDQTVYGLVRRYFKKVTSLEHEHRKAIAEARARGLNSRQIAIEFNEKKIRRRDGQPWGPKDITRRWYQLNRLQRERAQKESMRAEKSEPQQRSA
jgi:DNA invertase Pin-like site-specific DNA recombinase